MSTQCTHALDSGEQCNAPALNGTAFCRHHDPSRPRRSTLNRRREPEPFELPDLSDKSAVLFAVNEVIQAFAQRRIKCSEAEVLINGLKLATKLMIEIEKEVANCSPQFFSHAELAPTAGEDVYQPTEQDLNEFTDTLENGTPDQLLHQFKSRQTASPTQSAPQRDTFAIAAHGEPPTASQP